MSTVPRDEDQLAQAGDGGRYQVDAQGVAGLLVGDLGTQINYFYRGTWTDGVAPAPLVSMSGAIASPYRGLNSFGERDAALFFGRESAAADVLAAMSQRLEGTGLLVVSGVSGAGKSSLVRAGVLPRLRGAGLGAAPEAASWPCLVFTPGSRPLEELAVRVAPTAGADAAAVRRELAAAPAGFALTARQAALSHSGPTDGDGSTDGAGQQRLLLVVDQFEQLFTQCESEDERLAFVTALHAAAATGDRRPAAAMVVVLVRADFEARLADYPILVSAVQNRYLLTAMTGRQLRMAITQPAVAAGARVDADLVQMLLDEVRTRSGAPGAASGGSIGAGVLPLLSHALDQAWRSRAGQALTLADYERTGGIEGAVAASAQRAYDRLTPAQQSMARQVFTRLTATTMDGIDTAVRAARADLTAGKDEVQVREVEAVLETFTAERLLILAAGTVEISHEALLTAWPLLSDTWLADTHADRVIRTRLQATADEWNRAARDSSYLYAGSRLEIAAEAAARIAVDIRQTPLGGAEEDFLRASRRASRRRTRRLQAFTATLVVLVVGLAAVAVAAIRASHAATQSALAAVSGQLALASEAVAATDPVQAAQLAAASWRLAPSAHAQALARVSLLNVLAQPDRGAIAIPGDSVTTPYHYVAFGPDGKMLATASGDGTVRLWDVSSQRQIGAPMAADGKPVIAVAFSPGGKMLATASEDGAARLWDVATHKQIGVPIPADRDVAFSPDGKILATASNDGTARLWGVATHKQIGAPMTMGKAAVFAVAFSPDGKTLAIVSGSNVTVWLWNVATQQQVGALSFGNTYVIALAFSPDGTRLAAGSESGSGAAIVRLWNIGTEQEIGAPMTVDSAFVEDVAFSPNGQILATVSQDDTARLWDVSTQGQIGVPMIAGRSQAFAVAFSPNGQTLATADCDGTARLWDVAIQRQIGAPMTAARDCVYDLAFSPDGKMLATAGEDGTVRLWDVATHKQIGASIDIPTAVHTVAFSPDGQILATGGGDGTARLWDVATHKQIGMLKTTDDDFVRDVAFSPDGKILATASNDGTARLWDVVTQQEIGTPMTADNRYVKGVAFSQDGTILATTSDDGTARFWDVATQQEIGPPVTPADTSLARVAFSPNGTILATTGGGASDGNPSTQLWNAAFPRDLNLIGAVCAITGNTSLTPVQWAADVPSEPFEQTCPQPVR